MGLNAALWHGATTRSPCGFSELKDVDYKSPNHQNSIQLSQPESFKIIKNKTKNTGVGKNKKQTDQTENPSMRGGGVSQLGCLPNKNAALPKPVWWHMSVLLALSFRQQDQLEVTSRCLKCSRIA